MADDRKGLEIAQLVFFTPALFVAIYVTARHGFGRRAGWVFLVMLCLIRIVGPSLGLAFINGGQTNIGLFTGYSILASVGLSALLFVMLGMLRRVHDGLTSWRAPALSFLLIGVVLIAAITLVINGGIEEAPNRDAATMADGVKLIKAGISLITAVFVVQSLLALVGMREYRAITAREGPLLTAVLLSIPFLLVRLLYALLSVFGANPATFNFITGSVLAQGLMASMPEFIIVILYLWAGVLAPQLAVGQSITHGHEDALNDPEGGHLEAPTGGRWRSK